MYVYTPPSVYTQKIVLIDESQEHKRSPHEIQVVRVTNEVQTAAKTTAQTKSELQ